MRTKARNLRRWVSTKARNARLRVRTKSEMDFVRNRSLVERVFVCTGRGHSAHENLEPPLLRAHQIMLACRDLVV